MSLPKAPTRLDLPTDFVAFMADVAEMIRGADEAVVHGYDDSLQCASCVGGPLDSDATEFGFTYFPADGGGNVTWELRLSAEEVCRIGAGELLSLAGWKCAHDECQNRFNREDGYCRICDHPLGRDAVLDQARRLNELGEKFRLKCEREGLDPTKMDPEEMRKRARDLLEGDKSEDGSTH